MSKAEAFAGRTDLRKELRANPTVISLLGRDEGIKWQALRMVRKHFLGAEGVDLNEVQVDGDLLTPSQRSEVLQPPFLADWRLLVYRGSRPEQIGRVAASTVVLSWSVPFVDGLKVDCARLFGKELRRWARARAQVMGIAIDPDDLYAACAQASDLFELEAVLFKLSLLSAPSRRDAEGLACERDAASWQVVSALLSRDRSGFVRGWVSATREAMPLALSSAILRQVRNAVCLKLGAETGASEYEVERLTGLVARHTGEALGHLYGACVHLDDRLRAGAGFEAVVRFLVDLRGWGL